MFWLLRCAVAIGVLYWLSPLRAPDMGEVPEWGAVETRWRAGSDKVRGLALDSVGRDAAFGALSALQRSPAARETSPEKP